jgi:hypothetical protein
MTEPIFRNADRLTPKFRPFRALHHFRKLLADKEDTEQVFHIFQCLPRLAFVDEARAFVYSEVGEALRASPIFPTCSMTTSGYEQCRTAALPMLISTLWSARA